MGSLWLIIGTVVAMLVVAVIRTAPSSIDEGWVAKSLYVIIPAIGVSGAVSPWLDSWYAWAATWVLPVVILGMVVRLLFCVFDIDPRLYLELLFSPGPDMEEVARHQAAARAEQARQRAAMLRVVPPPEDGNG